MQIRIRTTGAVMYEAELRQWARDNNGPSWGITTTEVLESLDADVVFEGPQATTVPPYEFSYRNGVAQDEQGRWFTRYSVGPVFADSETEGTAAEQMVEYKARMDEEQAKRIRADRNTRLNDSDWSQIGDSTADKAAWATYRQALRDVPTQAGFPWTITWPETP